MANLGGRVIACLEARYASELADLVARHGGITYQAPCLREVHLPDATETRMAVDLICDRQVTGVVFLTGVGVQTIVEGADLIGRQDELLAALAGMRVAARGPKTQNALRRLGVRVDLIAPEPFTSDALLAEIERCWTLDGETVLVQRYGAPVPNFTDGLRRLGAEVVEASPYRWERPEDEQPVLRLIEDLAAGWIDVLAATSAAQVDHLFDIAHQRGQETALRAALERPGLRVAAQGIVCAGAFERRGVKVDLIPSRASMGALVLEIANVVNRLPEVGTALASGTVAFFVAQEVSREALERVLDTVSPHAQIAVLDGRARLLEQLCVKRGFAVQCVPPTRDAGSGLSHPADGLIQRATSVVIVTGVRRSVEVRRVLKLAERYAKPVQVIAAA